MTQDQLDQLARIERLSGKKNFEMLTVTADGFPFAIEDAIDDKVRALGYNIGIMCGDDPRALSKSALYIAKWRNIPSTDYPMLDGVVFCDDFRNGVEATIVLLV